MLEGPERRQSAGRPRSGLPLRVVERTGLVEDGVGNGQLADVVEQSRALHVDELRALEAELASHVDREVDDAFEWSPV